MAKFHYLKRCQTMCTVNDAQITLSDKRCENSDVIYILPKMNITYFKTRIRNIWIYGHIHDKTKSNQSDEDDPD